MTDKEKISMEIARREVAQWKSRYIINELMSKQGMNEGQATKTWYKSKTKKLTLDSEDLYFVSAPRCYDELLKELSGDERWMMGSFE